MTDSGRGLMARQRRQVALLGVATVFLFGGLGVWFIHLQERSLLSLLMGPWVWYWQLLVGAGMGLATGHAAWWIVRQPFMRTVLLRYSDRLGGLLGRRSDRIFVSLCAGVGEELFFRGALQYWLGIPITAVIFIAIHGYLDPRNWRISVYGLAMTGVIIVYGAMAEHIGLLSAMVAHAVLDMVLLEKLHRNWQRRNDRWLDADPGQALQGMEVGPDPQRLVE